MEEKDPGILGHLHPMLKLLLLAATMIASMLVVMVIGILLAVPFFGADALQTLGQDTMDINFMRYVQILSHLGLFITAGIVFAFLVGYNPLGYFRGKKVPSVRALLISAAIIVVAAPMVYYLTYINQQMSLPESMRGIEEWMRSAEESAEAVTRMLLDVSTLQGLLFNIFMIAIIPAIGEEFIFRGALQRIFHQWTRNAHVAVLIAAILFSAMHLQFYGFLPRLLLGALMGYMFVITGNIWVPVFAHFFNNAVAVTIYFFTNQTATDFDPGSLGAGPLAVILAVASLVVVLILFSVLRPRNAQGQDEE